MFSSLLHLRPLQIRYSFSKLTVRQAGFRPVAQVLASFTLFFSPLYTHKHTLSQSLSVSRTDKPSAPLSNIKSVSAVTMHLSDSIHSIRLPWISKASILLFISVLRKYLLVSLTLPVFFSPSSLLHAHAVFRLKWTFKKRK